MPQFPFFRQLDAMDCGPACLRMVAKYYGRSVPLEFLRSKSQFGKGGVSMLGLADAAESIGLRSIGAKLTFEELINEAPKPAIVHWSHYHFVVLTPQSNKKKLVIADPARGLITLNRNEFLQHWISTREEGMDKGTALLLESTPLFEKMDYEESAVPVVDKIGWRSLSTYLKEHRRFFIQILIGLLFGSFLQLLFPFLTQGIVDNGINTGNLTFIEIVLIAQLILLTSQTAVDFIRSRILLHISTRINIALLSGFWSKLLRLPMHFFDSKHPGDIMQRLGDHRRIEVFLTSTALSTFVSIFSLIIFSCVLLQYSVTVFLIFSAGSIAYFFWIRFFLKYRRQLDYKRFSIAARENNATMQLVYGIQEIKLNNAENTYRWAWEGLQAGLFKLNYKNLSLNQYQQLGAFFINQGKNVFITFIVAKMVIEGQLTLGVMMAVQYIIGQLNSPIEQLISFMQQAQDAKISLERLNDIQVVEDEEPVHKRFKTELGDDHSIELTDVCFTYPGAGNEPVLNKINLKIPHGKVTAIVGSSGSGKTTLLKLLLKFYDNYSGEMRLGGGDFRNVSPRYWRSITGAVMQDSFIFSDSIQKNITVSDETVNTDRLIEACKTANILQFIEALPSKFHTRLGAEGNGISGGQKQRLAIARAVYKDPAIICFDEATNSLDANNERTILDNLQTFFNRRTVVVVAHRLSTVKNADKIVVMDAGKIVEEGTHEELTLLRGKYYDLVKNQLELGN